MYFGAREVDSIFERLAKEITNMKVNPNEKDENGHYKYVGLVNNRGEIQNDLLTYLNPLLPSDNYPIGRMLLAESQMDVSGNMKRRFITAFSQLLQHSNPNIRQLAQDLAFFAYYASYDQNTPGSFFDLVPPAYRAQYDKSLSKGMKLLNDIDNKNSALNNMIGTTDVMSGINSMFDIMCRNYWYNDDLVPPYSYKDDEYDPENPTNIFDQKYGETVFGNYYDKDANWEFPGLIVSNKIKDSAKYIKLQHNRVSYLYKKVGYVTRNPKQDGGVGASSFDIFIVVPKAGAKQKSVTQFEFYADYSHDSIFGENRLPAKFAEDKLREIL